MREIGVIASEASETEARVILSEGEEKKSKAEDLVMVENRNGGLIMAVLRKGLGSNENLRAGGYHPGVAYARIGGKPSTAKETYDFGLSVIGEEGESIQQNKRIVAPGSIVKVFEESDDPMRMLAGKKHTSTLGHYEGHPSWKVPVDSSFISYHIGIFASTGGGKSYLARHQVIPLLQKSGYDVLVLDWKGRDYAPHFRKDDVLSIADLSLDSKTVASYLVKKADRFGYSPYGGTVSQALEEFIYDEGWRGLNAKDFRSTLERSVVNALNPQRIQSGRPYEDEQRFRRGLRRLKESDIQNILGTKTPKDVLDLVRQSHIRIIDMKKTGRDEKLSAFLSIANYLMDLMRGDEDIDLAIVIDEAPQYCPFNPDEIQRTTADIIIDMCALGRTHKLCVTLLSQGMAGEIGINAAVRRNLNTQFVGKIHPLDMAEASNWFAPFNIDPKFLLSLPPGHFYFMGNLNPSPIPLLITFSIPG
ncbi:MAG: ATP-binding protein [Thaumarchaeota archaeon]|nr:ATP-binding protein [Nitrososphaerota archaeon]